MADSEIDYVCKNGRRVTIEIDDLSYTASVFDEDHRDIGQFSFGERDGPVLKLTWAHLDKLGEAYTRQGIGRRCLQLVKERYGLPIIAEDDDGIRKDDGSHLTGDAPAFVAQMRKEGLIAHSEQSLPDGHIDD
jgi:hypothetical protein